MASIITLRHHSRGSQHLKKSCKTVQEYKNKIKNEPASKMKPDPEDNDTGYDLYTVLGKQSKSIVGLRYISEFIDDIRKPLYHCRLQQCENEQGDAGYMSRHIFCLKHRHAWVQEDQNNFTLLKLDSVVSYVDGHKEDLKRDYGNITQVQNEDLYNKVKNSELRSSNTLPPMKKRPKQETDFLPNIKKFKYDHSDIAADDDIAEPEPEEEKPFNPVQGVLGMQAAADPSAVHNGDTKPMITDDDIKKQFKKDIAEVVKSCLNAHYPTADDYQEGNKALTKDEYMKAAIRYTKSMKTELLNEFMKTNTSVRSLCVTSKYEHRIKTAVNKYLEELNNQ